MKKTIAILLAVILALAVMPAALASGAVSNASKTTVYRTTAALNMRTGAGSSYKKIATLKKGTAFTVQKKSGNWYKIKVLRTGKTGWVSKNYTTKNAYARVTTKNNGLNVRSTPIAYSDWRNVKGSMPKGAKNVTVKYISGNWAYVKYGKLEGWSSRTFLEWMV